MYLKKFLCFFMIFIIFFLNVSPVFTLAAGGTDSWLPNDENHDGIVDENDLILYCGKQGYILNERQFQTAINNFEYARAELFAESVDILNYPDKLGALALYILNTKDYKMDDLTQSQWKEILLEFDTQLKATAPSDISDDEITAFVTDYVMDIMKSSSFDLDDVMAEMNGYIVVPTVAPSQIPVSHFYSPQNQASIMGHSNLDYYAYITKNNWYDIYYGIGVDNNIFDRSFVANVSVDDFESGFLYTWSNTQKYIKQSVANITLDIDDVTTNKGVQLYSYDSVPSMLYVCYYGGTYYRNDNESGSWSTAQASENVSTFEFYCGMGSDYVIRTNVFLTTKENGGIPIFRSVVELSKFSNAQTTFVNCPAMLNIDWSDFPYDAFDFSEFSDAIIQAIIDNHGITATELQKIIEDTLISYIESIDENVAEILKLLRRGLFSDDDVPYLKLILNKLNELHFEIDADDLELNIDLTDVLRELDALETLISNNGNTLSDTKTVVSNILIAQLETNDKLDDIYDFMLELDQNIDFILSALNNIGNKIDDSNDKLDTLISILRTFRADGGAPNGLIDSDDNPQDIANKINSVINTLFPLTSKELMKTKFPFSLPFDILVFIELFDKTAVRPYANFEIPLGDEVVEYYFEFPELLDPLIDLFQTFCKIGFCVLLIKLSRDYIGYFNDLND